MLRIIEMMRDCQEWVVNYFLGRKITEHIIIHIIPCIEMKNFCGLIYYLFPIVCKVIHVINPIFPFGVNINDSGRWSMYLEVDAQPCFRFTKITV